MQELKNWHHVAQEIIMCEGLVEECWRHQLWSATLVQRKHRDFTVFPDFCPDPALIGRQQRMSNHHRTQSMLGASPSDSPRVLGSENLEPCLLQYSSADMR
jgi:hypothetical protein